MKKEVAISTLLSLITLFSSQLPAESEELCCTRTCLGPAVKQGNPPLYPYTCDGDWVVGITGLYWKAESEGMEYAIENYVTASDMLSGNREMNNLINAKIYSPKFGKDFGVKIIAGYNSPCDGWDFRFNWTTLYDHSLEEVRANFDDNIALLPLWTAFLYPNAGQAPILFANQINTFSKLKFNLFHFLLGREYWISKRLSLHPFIGLSLSYIDQLFEIDHKGGSWSDPGLNLHYNDWVRLKNDFKAAGMRSGLDSIWHLGCGWAIYGEFALSALYGRFSLHHEEWLQDSHSPFSKTQLLDTKSSFRATRGELDLNFGIQWAYLSCSKDYALQLRLGFEQMLFFHQNQLFRVQRVGGTNNSSIVNS